MVIKKVSLCGIKTYRHKTELHLHPNVNIVLGKNGSGKSNLYYAILHAISSKTLNGLKRCALLSNVPGVPQKAQVQLTLDNQSQQLPFYGEELICLREFDTQNDHFKIGNKLVNKDEFTTLFSIAGFEEANPFFYVNSKIFDELIFMTDKQRMHMFKCILGLETKKMNELLMQSRIQRMDKTMSLIREQCSRFSQLLQQLESERKSISARSEPQKQAYLLREAIRKRMRDAKASELQQLNEQLRFSDQQSYKLAMTKEELSAEIDFLHHEKKSLLFEAEKEKRIWEILDEKSDELILQKQQFEIILLSIENDKSTLLEQVELLENEEKSLFENEYKIRKNLEGIEQQYSLIKNHIDELRKKIYEVQLRKESLINEGASSFESQEKRDEHLNRKIDLIITEINFKLKQTKEIETLCLNNEKERKNLSTQIENMNKEIKDWQKKEVLTNYYAVKSQYEKTKDDLSSFEKKEITLKRNLQQIEEERNVISRKLTKKVSKSILLGAENMSRLIEELKSGTEKEQQLALNYHGLVVQNFNVDPVMFIAIDSTVGRKLYSHIVKNKTTAQELLKEFNLRKFNGIVHFIPVEGLIFKECEGIEIEQTQQLVKHLEYSLYLAPVMEFLFGHIFITRSIPEPNLKQLYPKLLFVSLCGDVVFSENRFFGGYICKEKTILHLYNFLVQSDEKMEDQFEDIQKLNLKIEQKRSTFAILREELEVQELVLNKNEDRINLITKRSGELAKHILMMDQQFHKYKKDLDRLSSEIKLQQDEVESLKQILNKKNSPEIFQGNPLEEVCSLLKELKKQLKVEMNKLEVIEKKKSKQEAHLIKYVQIRLNEIQTSLLELRLAVSGVEVKMEDTSTSLSKHQSLLSKVSERKFEVNRKLQESEEQIKEKEEILQKLTNELNEIILQMQKLDQEKYNLALKCEDLRHLIENSDNGYDSDDQELIPYMQLDLNELNSQLISVQKELGFFTYKVQSQVLGYDRRINMLNQKLERSDLIERLLGIFKKLHQKFNERKSSVLSSSLKTLNQKFTSIFENMVPHGRACLKIIQITSQTSNSSEESPLALSSTDSSNNEFFYSSEYSELQICAQFGNSQVSSNCNFISLSGGQKSLLALGFILAVHEVAPLPLYMFDEIDAALNSYNRVILTEMIKRLAQNSQIILTTFNRELLDIGNKFFTICFQKGTSTIDEVSKENALMFILEDDEPAAKSTSFSSVSVTFDSTNSPELSQASLLI